MNRRLVVCLSTLGLSGVLAAQGASDATPRVVTARTNYVDVAARLDKGGDLYVIANVEGAIQSAISDLTDLVNALPPARETTTAKSVVSRLGPFLQKHGFYAVNGVGLSVVPRADGLNNVKLYAGRDPQAASSLFWRAWVGGQARRLTSLDFLPADTVLARAGTSDPKALWRLVLTGVREIGTTNSAQAFDKAVAAKGREFGMRIDSLVASLGEESAFSIQLSKTETVPVPVGAEALSIPAPSLLLVIAVRDTVLHDFAMASLTNNGLPLVRTSGDGADVTSVGMPLPLPIACQPSMATHRGFLLIGSTPDVVKAALQAAAATNGLLAEPEFKDAFAGQRLDLNNGILYINPRVAQLAGRIQQAAMAPTANARNGDAHVEAVHRLLTGEHLKSCALVIYNLRAGVLVSGTSSAGGREVLASTALAPLGLVAGIAMPSFIKARAESRSAGCRNNLRILDAAKEQWAMEVGASMGDEPNPNGFLRFVKGGRLPVCPQGGTYSLNAIGTDPSCSFPSHRRR